MTASVLTNTSAMTALQTLRDTNSNLRSVNDQISTGKEIAAAKDNASIFAISEVMEADVAGFQAVSDSLSLGQSTLGVASNAAESVGDLLNQIKGKIVAANEDNVDRQKLQNEVGSLREQINGIVSSAQFNGLNLIDGSTNTSGFDVLSSLDRDASGSVTTNNISLDTTNTDLSTSGGTALSVNGTADTTVTGANVFQIANQDNSGGSGATVGPNGAATVTLTESDGGTTTDGIAIGGFDFQIGGGVFTGGTTAVSDATAGVDDTNTGGLLAGDSITITVGNASARYTVAEGDAQGDISAGLREGLINAGLNTDDVSLTVNGNGELEVSNQTTNEVDVEMSSARASGGLAGLDSLDVSNAAGAQQALTDIEGFIQTAVDAQAAIGTVESRLEIQNDFMSSLIDSFEAGIGSLVDADLEEASARLQALQVQQQLGTQALSIANQQPQNLLALFR